jgi:hypothetical protein
MSVNEIYPTKRNQDFADGFVKLYAGGKIGLLFSGDARYWRAAEQCFRQSLDISVRINANLFANEMRNRGASEQAIHEFLNNFNLVDEVYLSSKA